MKTKQWLLLALGVGLGSIATGLPAATPETNVTEKAAPAKPFVPEPAVAKQNSVNVRGQAAINSEVVARLQKGQTVTVLEDITLKKPKTDEPARWYRIALPTNVVVWVNGDYIDATNQTVKPRRLNLRSGPGENHCVLGRLEKGAAVHVLATNDGWLKIQAPADASGFVAAHLLDRQAGLSTPVTPPVQPTIVAVTKAPADTIAPVETKPPTVTEVKTNELVAIAQPPMLTNPPPAAPLTNVATAIPPPPTPTEPSATNTTTIVSATPPATNAAAIAPPPPELVKRIVLREGVLKGHTSIQAPTYFELRSLENNRLINYVWSPGTNVTLKQFKGKKVVVTGEELLDERWPNTPVISVDSIGDAP